MTTKQIVIKFNKKIRQDLRDKTIKQIRAEEERDESQINELKENKFKRSNLEY